MKTFTYDRKGAGLHIDPPPSDTPPPIPRAPLALRALLRVLPLTSMSWSLTAYSRRLANRHPGLFRRLGQHDQARFILDPTDLPIVLRLHPNRGVPNMAMLRKADDYDVAIRGPLAALLGLVHGAYDGDALFFSRDLVVEGDTAAALALRNAVDDAELDLTEELAQITGPLAGPLRQFSALVERRTGVCLHRSEEAGLW
ncbi:SCP2 sterol-binding domain-containing protein [uncultured Pelagimonas sp.]|uniref:ubiquinone anaerobic biosynthesis accessory factor UbiT n=1 Tax=uncultured Pelagimonas sp. TaxID=1618102 RepID=UPI0026383830|nr:SCP2 sterol-binding domain-containing protein [uncultured Pelagimonas sp.]